MSDSRRPPLVRVLLVLVPLWLLGSGAGALWYYFHKEKKDALIEQERFAQAVSVPSIADDLEKIVEVIGERNASSPDASVGLSRVASMIEGLLGPSNTGYAVKKIDGPAAWPILQATLAGKLPDAPAVWVLATYDSPQGSRGSEKNGSGLAATLAAAQAMAQDQPGAPVYFVFLPHANDAGSPVAETVAKFADLANGGAPPKAVLCVETMGAGETLWLSSLQSDALPLALASGLGAVRNVKSANPHDEDLTTRLHETGLPAVRVASGTRPEPGELNERLPFAPTVAASAGRLIELIRRCANR